MNIEKSGYQSSQEEMRKAENSMTEKQKETTKIREESYNAGAENTKKEELVKDKEQQESIDAQKIEETRQKMSEQKEVEDGDFENLTPVYDENGRIVNEALADRLGHFINKSGKSYDGGLFSIDLFENKVLYSDAGSLFSNLTKKQREKKAEKVAIEYEKLYQELKDVKIKMDDYGRYFVKGKINGHEIELGYYDYGKIDGNNLTKEDAHKIINKYAPFFELEEIKIRNTQNKEKQLEYQKEHADAIKAAKDILK